MTRPSSSATSAHAISLTGIRGRKTSGCDALVEDLEVDGDLSSVEGVVGVVEGRVAKAGRPELVEDARFVALETAGAAGLDRCLQPLGRRPGIGHRLVDRLDEPVARRIHQLAHDLIEPAEVVEHRRRLHVGGGGDGSQCRALGALVHGDLAGGVEDRESSLGFAAGAGHPIILPQTDAVCGHLGREV